MMVYKKYFRLLENGLYDERFTNRFLTCLQGLLDNLNQDPPKRTELTYKPWVLPEGRHIIKPHVEILKAIGKILKIKLMWRNIVSMHDGEVKRGLWVIGEELRVDLFIMVSDHFFIGYFGYSKWLNKNSKEEAKKANYKSVRSYTSKLISAQRDTITNYINEILEYDITYNLNLENSIKERYKLDFKNYHADHPEYYYALSKRFHHKRMLI